MDKRYDTGDPENSGLYGQPHERGAMRNQEFLDEWYGKIVEVIDNYSPDFIWFDFALDSIAEGYVKDFLAYYYNHAEANNKEVVVTYKGNAKYFVDMDQHLNQKQKLQKMQNLPSRHENDRSDD